MKTVPGVLLKSADSIFCCQKVQLGVVMVMDDGGCEMVIFEDRVSVEWLTDLFVMARAAFGWCVT